MPQVHFVGEIEDLNVETDFASVSFAFLPGNTSWYLKAGHAFGESGTCVVDVVTGDAVVNHPIDNHYETTTVENWPCLILEVIKK